MNKFRNDKLTTETFEKETNNMIILQTVSGYNINDKWNILKRKYILPSGEIYSVENCI